MTKLNKDIARETNTTIRDRGKERLLTMTVKVGSGQYGDYIELRPKGVSNPTYTVTVKEIWGYAESKKIKAAGLGS